MDYRSIDMNAVKTWMIGRTITSIIIFTVYVLINHFVIIPKFYHIFMVRYLMNILGFIIILTAILDSFVWPFLEYQQWKYGIFKDKIELIKGIIVRKKIIIPISRIQNLKIEQGPIQRIYKISSINIITAGGCHVIPAIPVEEAEMISERLKRIIEMGEKNG
ncbi:PH domain-containing protein [Clostridium luticellarii]|jgi:membrane protein YdbS with pleckstrin-like domain|uniref:Bacterial membrane flanked domain protein n=1 Tax=Clostridium luticellarii TaxID=1691940 RepID=A0A2T0BPP5_9CLOT|nr:PH domain-containing protein [Clostridium luticellarii]MCI1944227.1 PH domain-containing protein [Clostridium luticellarii]MCI1967729.1 PH domain-containing protein [Clostridium luticellarii]MCI1994822.1 PH domain-containing protein [Clostridium luticellarii]MCI2039693.1 PH domain-containing protein [Clostridium luticellarii]PRR85840.1 Bacterial membrane flanked domain protein [Clostridium luticellarii]